MKMWSLKSPEAVTADRRQRLAAFRQLYRVSRSSLSGQCGDNVIIPDLNPPAEIKCSRCHKFQPKLPDFSEEDQSCLQCHLVVSGDDPPSAEKTAAFCFHCHGSNRRHPEWQTHSSSVDRRSAICINTPRGCFLHGLPSTGRGIRPQRSTGWRLQTVSPAP